MIQIQWWWPVMIQIEWWSRSSLVMLIQIKRWSRSSGDVPWWSRSTDDPDLVMMLHDDLDREMIQIRWRWLEDEDDLKTNMTWRRDDPADTEKKTCADKLCQENTFLVKRECWCNCNFGMYSLVFLIYCNPMFIPGCIVMYLSHVIPRCLFREVSIMRNSCQVIVGNPPIGQGIKVP